MYVGGQLSESSLLTALVAIYTLPKHGTHPFPNGGKLTFQGHCIQLKSMTW